MILTGASVTLPGSWIPYSPTYGGFSVNPSAGAVQYMILGDLCILIHDTQTDGTSNATSFTISLPFPSMSIGIYGSAKIKNNGVDAAAPGLVEVVGSTINLYRDYTGLTWTASGAKNARFTCLYAINI